MAVILDTNALSAFAEGDEKLLRVLENDAELALPAIVLGEYLYGIQQSRLRASYELGSKQAFRFSNSSRLFAKPPRDTPRSAVS